jgi:hypothetical protein
MTDTHFLLVLEAGGPWSAIQKMQLLVRAPCLALTWWFFSRANGERKTEPAFVWIPIQ